MDICGYTCMCTDMWTLEEDLEKIPQSTLPYSLRYGLQFKPELVKIAD